MKRSTRLMLVAGIALSSGCATQVPDDFYTTNHDFFDLTCSGETTRNKRELHVDIDAHGQFEVTLVEGGVGTRVDARTYTNAVIWTEGNDRWTLDRVKGTLESKSAKEVLVCDRAGGRRF